jgi:hypothetical protein
MRPARVAYQDSSSLPLHLAAAREVASRRVVRRLVRAWPQAIYEKNRMGLTPLQVALASGWQDPAILEVLTNGLPK